MLVQLCAELVVFLGPISYLIDSLVRQRRKHSLFLGRSESQRTHFSGFPQLVDGSYLKQLCAFLPPQGSHVPPSLTSARFNVITIALSTTLSALSRVTNTLAFVFLFFCLTFPLRNNRSEPSEFRQHALFLICATAHQNYPAVRILRPPCFLCGSSNLVVFAPSSAAYIFRFAYRTVLAVFCFCCFVLARIPCFFCVSVLAKLSTPFSVGGAFFYSVFTFFALRIAVSYSWLYSVREVWFVSTCHSRQGNSCVRAPLRSRSNLIFALLSKFCPFRRGHHVSESRVCVSLPQGPRWLFLLSRHRKAISAAPNQKPFCK